MKQITEITQEARQNLNVIGENNENIEIDLYYYPTQLGWFMDVTYEAFSVKGLKIVASQNILYPFKNRLPFGMACTVGDGGDPYFVDDFVNGRAIIYLLNEIEVGLNEGLIN